MEEERFNRRDIMKGAGVAAVATVAGCSSTDQEPNTGDNTDEDTTTTENQPEELGEPVPKLTLLTRTKQYGPYFDIADLIAQQWRKLGIEVELNAVSGKRSVQLALVDQDYESFAISWSANPERLDPGYLYDHYHSSNTDPGQLNFSFFTNSEYDKLAEKQRTIYDDDERQDVVYECQKILAEQHPSTPIVTKMFLGPYNKDRVSNIEGHAKSIQGLSSFWVHNNVETPDGKFHWGERNQVRGINPLDLKSTMDRRSLRLIYDSLYRINVEGLPEPWAAESGEKVDDTTFKVTLRDGMQWHDGEPVTAEDVAFSFEYMRENSPTQGAKLNVLESAEVTADNEVTFNLKKPFAPFIHNGLGRTFIIPKHIWKDVPDSVDADKAVEWENPEPVGSGPFKFESWRPAEEFRAVANEDHFNPPNIDEFIRHEGPLQTLLRLLEDGELDAVGGSGLNKSRVEELAKMDSIDTNETDTNGWYRVSYNNRRKPYSDAAFRRALGRAVPSKDIQDLVFYGYGTLCNTPVPPTVEFWNNPDVGWTGFDLEKAKQELRDGGYGWDDDGKLHYPA